MRNKMDLAIVLIVAVIAVLIFVIFYLLTIEAPRQSSNRYINEIHAEAELLSKVKPTIAAGVISWPTVDQNGKVVMVHRQVGTDQPLAAPIDQQVDQKQIDKDIATWSAAVELVKRSISGNPAAHQLVTAGEFGSGSTFDDAIRAMKSHGWVRTVRGGSDAGTFVTAEVENVTNLLELVSGESMVAKLRRPPAGDKTQV